MYYNNDTTAGNYRYTWLYSDGTTANAASGDAANAFQVAAGGSLANSCGSFHVKIINYTGTTFLKEATVHNSLRNSVGTERTIVSAHNWESTAAINRVDLVLVAGNYATGSTLRLYGVY
jgi:hypothetical protein